MGKPQLELQRSPSKPPPPLLVLLLMSCAVRSAASEGLRPISKGCRTGESLLPLEAGGHDRSKTEVHSIASCKEKYRRFYKNHTACLTPSMSATQTGMQEYSKERIVKLHNYYRSRVGDDAWQRQPTASNMQQMYWDEELALIAQGWASQCRFYHEEPAGRYIPGSYSVGQNLASGHVNWDAAIRHWYSEVIELSFGVGRRLPKSTVGHYTQLVWADSSRVGCGFAKCNKTMTPFYVCNYGPTGNYPSNKYTPYLAGRKGSSCPSTFKDGLCDCGGKVCKNKGVLNVTSCQCTCPKLDWIGGEDCSLDCASATDSQLCSTKGGHLTGDDCWLVEEVAFELCPIMCGLCAGTVKEIKNVGSDCGAVTGTEDRAEAEEQPLAAPTAAAFRHESAQDSKLAKLMELLGLEAAEQPARAGEIQLESRSQAEHTKSASRAAGQLPPTAGASALGSDQPEKEAKLRWLKARLGLEQLDGPLLPAAGRDPFGHALASPAAAHARRQQEQPPHPAWAATAGKAAASATTPAAASQPKGRTAAERKDLWDRLVLGRLAHARSARPAT